MKTCTHIILKKNDLFYLIKCFSIFWNCVCLFMKLKSHEFEVIQYVIKK
jgi:hypothetical protein